MKFTTGVMMNRCIHCNHVLTRYFSSVAHVGTSPVSGSTSHYVRSQCLTGGFISHSVQVHRSLTSIITLQRKDSAKGASEGTTV